MSVSRMGMRRAYVRLGGGDYEGDIVLMSFFN